MFAEGYTVIKVIPFIFSQQIHNFFLHLKLLQKTHDGARSELCVLFATFYQSIVVVQFQAFSLYDLK